MTLEELDNLGKFVREQYIRQAYAYYDRNCESKKVRISDARLEIIINGFALRDACEAIKTDLRFIAQRRDKLMTGDRPSLGKTAGVVAFRLARYPIIHPGSVCCACNSQCLTKLHIELAVRTALNYINRRYLNVEEGVRNELLYTMMYRHTNQEMLGLIFDTIALTPSV
jgi:hypothetical protein